MKTSLPSDTTRLFLVRHGATTANESRPYILQGRGTDLPLSELGRDQAAAVGRFLSVYPIDSVFSSPLKRAVETAQAVANHHHLEVETIDQLTECDVGAWEGKDWDSVMREYPDAYRRFMADPSQNAYVGGESYQDVLRRVEPAIAQLLEQHTGATIAIAAHNVVNRVYLSTLLGLEVRQAKDIKQSNACVNVIRYRHGETDLITLNAIFHLDGL